MVETTETRLHVWVLVNMSIKISTVCLLFLLWCRFPTNIYTYTIIVMRVQVSACKKYNQKSCIFMVSLEIYEKHFSKIRGKGTKKSNDTYQNYDGTSFKGIKLLRKKSSSNDKKISEKKILSCRQKLIILSFCCTSFVLIQPGTFSPAAGT